MRVLILTILLSINVSACNKKNNLLDLKKVTEQVKPKRVEPLRYERPKDVSQDLIRLTERNKQEAWEAYLTMGPSEFKEFVNKQVNTL